MRKYYQNACLSCIKKNAFKLLLLSKMQYNNLDKLFLSLHLNTELEWYTSGHGFSSSRHCWLKFGSMLFLSKS